MKEYLIISINSNILTYDFRSIDESLKKYVNKNEFNNNTLYFSMKYYSKNYEKIINLIKQNLFKKSNQKKMDIYKKYMQKK